MKPTLALTFLAFLALSLPVPAVTYVSTNPTLTTGADAIDPAGARDVAVNATGSTSQATLEGLTGFAAIQSFSGLTPAPGNQSTANDYIFSFTAVDRADLRLTYTGNPNTTKSVLIASDSFSTSSNSSVRMESTENAGDSLTLTIQLGDWNGTSFTAFTNQGVGAFGFTLTGAYDFVLNDTVTATFFNPAGGILSTQTITSATGTTTVGTAGYFGHQATAGTLIGRVQISYADAAGLNTPVFGLDDLGYTATIPEPSTAAMLLGGVGMLTLMRRRRRQS